jgi:hypothetical protein
MPTCGDPPGDDCTRLGVQLGVRTPEDPDLAAVIAAWSRLASPLRVAILALVRADSEPR